jgi:hypothetical protein
MVFEQQPRESAKAFAAFSQYLNLGVERSLEATAEKLGKSKRLMEKWSKRFDWSARVSAHGAHLALVEREAAEAVATAKGVDWAAREAEQRDLEWENRCELVELAREAIARWKKNPNKYGTLEGIARLLDLASKLGRLASGMPTDHTEVKKEIHAKIDVDWEIALKKMYAEVEAPRSAAVDSAVVDVLEVQPDQSLLTSAPTGEGK